MKLDGLSLEQAPPISVPFRFFLAAPLFGLLSALLLTLLGADVLLSRWTPGMLAIAHGWLLGFFATVMFGALLQMLPVLAGAVISSPRGLANLLLPLWLGGVVVLQAAFLRSEPGLYIVAALMLGAAVVAFAFFCGAALFRATSQIDSVLGMKLALFSLLITLVLGFVLAIGHGGLTTLLRPVGTDVHAMWGLLGWIGLLVTAVSWQVVPMFQITAAYPRWMVRFLAPLLFGLFLLRMLLVLVPVFSDEMGQAPALVTVLLDLAISALLIAFAVATLWLQHRRKRKVSDTHPHYWRIACVSLMVVIACWWSAHLTADLSLREQLKLLAVLIFITGFVMAIMTAMLYKIVAFLVWFHLQGVNTKRMMAGESMIQVPHMKAVISEKRARFQFKAFLAALLLVPLALVWPSLYWLAGALWGLHFTIILINLSSAAAQYRRIEQGL